MAGPKRSTEMNESGQPSASQFYHFAGARKAPAATKPTTGVKDAANVIRGRHLHQVDIREELARRERIRNDDAEQDIRLKSSTLDRLFRFLKAETVAIFLLAFLQGVHAPWDFRLEEWSFKVLITATIAQITAMLYVAVSYLFPKNRRLK